jgi:hypothetical protein
MGCRCRWLTARPLEARHWPEVLAALPPHCTTSVMQLARQYGQMWLEVAQELDERADATQPWSAAPRPRENQVPAAGDLPRVRLRPP